MKTRYVLADGEEPVQPGNETGRERLTQNCVPRWQRHVLWAQSNHELASTLLSSEVDAPQSPLD